VAGGGDPWGTHSREGKIIRTFTQDAVLRIPPAPCPEADRKLLRATGRSVIGATRSRTQPAGWVDSGHERRSTIRLTEYPSSSNSHHRVT